MVVGKKDRMGKESSGGKDFFKFFLYRIFVASVPGLVCCGACTLGNIFITFCLRK